jgi:uncharacterized membrane protein YedE/YeeE
MHHKIQIPPLKNFLGIIIVIIISLWIKAELTSESGLFYLSLWIGLMLGVVLQRSRFCFYCLSRDFIEKKDASGLLGILLSLVIGTIGYHFVFGAFLIEPVKPYLPPNAHISPVSLVLILGSLSFGFGMSIAGSCISAQLYRLGEGLLSAVLSLVGVLIGFIIAYQCWNFFYINFISNSPIIWFPHYLGYGGSIFLQLLLLVLISIFLFFFHRPQNKLISHHWWENRWPTYIGGILVGLIGMIAFLRITPLGVTAELGRVSKLIAGYFEMMPSRLNGLDTLQGCISVVTNLFWSNNGLLISGVIMGSFAAAVFSNDFAIKVPNKNELARTFIGGLFMGFGAMIALGCTIGNLLSGIMTASLSGWVFLLFCFIGFYVGWAFRIKFDI